MPPNIAAMGLMTAQAVCASFRITASSSSTLSLAASLIAFAMSSISAASSTLPGVGMRPFFTRKASSAWYATCRMGERSILEKSDSRNSPGFASASARVLKVSDLEGLNCVTMPPRANSPNWVLSSSSSKWWGLQVFTRRGLPSFSCVMPSTSENTTMSPASNCRRSSSTHVTSVGLPALILAMIPVWGSSPSTSSTVKEGPKSQKTLAKTPLTSALMKGMAGDWAWQNSFTRCASLSSMSVQTTALCAPSSASVSDPPAAETTTAGLRSCSLSLHAAARFLPTSAGVR
mmetsp:Transcript_11816/g.29898  ORF Transcript_11816/g.29898 Transcript_11816/m.29898 type:complete len:289 (+) Transcript_11816:1507-2373(+)